MNYTQSTSVFYALALVLTLFCSCHGQPATHSKLPKVLKPQNTYVDAVIGCGLQDRHGNLWFGSNGEGIYQYDGHSFTHFTKDDGLYDNVIYSLLEDKKGIIWIGTQSGLCRFDGQRFESIPLSLTYSAMFYTAERSSVRNGVWCMLMDKNGVIWFGADDGVYCFNGIRFGRFLDDRAIVNKSNINLGVVYSMLEDKKGHIWFATGYDDGVCRFDGKTLSRISNFKADPVTEIAEDNNGTLWFSTIRHGVCRYDGKTFSENYFSEKGSLDLLKKAFVKNDNNGHLWLTKPKETGIIYRYDGNTLTSLITQDGLPKKTTGYVLQDKTGGHWFATEGMGLYRYDGKTIKHLSEQ